MPGWPRPRRTSTGDRAAGGRGPGASPRRSTPRAAHRLRPVSLVIVGAIFVVRDPTVRRLLARCGPRSPRSRRSSSRRSLAATVFNLFTYWLANMAALPGLRLGQAAVVTQTTTSVANTLPAGGAVAVGLTYSILRSWGFTGTAIALYIGVTGIWNIFMKLALPVLSLALLAITGQAAPALVVAALIGLAVLVVAVALFALALCEEGVRAADRRRARPVRLVVPEAVPQAAGHRRGASRRSTFRSARSCSSEALAPDHAHHGALATWRCASCCCSACATSASPSKRSARCRRSRCSRSAGCSRRCRSRRGARGDRARLHRRAGRGRRERGRRSSRPSCCSASSRTAIQIPLGGFTYLIWRVKKSWRREAPKAGARLDPERRAAARPGSGRRGRPSPVRRSAMSRTSVTRPRRPERDPRPSSTPATTSENQCACRYTRENAITNANPTAANSHSSPRRAGGAAAPAPARRRSRRRRPRARTGTRSRTTSTSGSGGRPRWKNAFTAVRISSAAAHVMHPGRERPPPPAEASQTATAIAEGIVTIPPPTTFRKRASSGQDAVADVVHPVEHRQVELARRTGASSGASRRRMPADRRRRRSTIAPSRTADQRTPGDGW